MFAVYCPRDRCRVLLDLSRIVALRNTPEGPVIHWQCWCGTRGSQAYVTRQRSQALGAV
jgi:hypothetical protein